MTRIWPFYTCAERITRLTALLATGCAVLAGCATSTAQPEAEPAAAGRVMLIGGAGYVVKQLTPGTWTATPQGPTQQATQHMKVATNAAQDKAAVEQAIENASGCKVTDSYYSGTGEQLDAQVQCAGLSN